MEKKARKKRSKIRLKASQLKPKEKSLIRTLQRSKSLSTLQGKKRPSNLKKKKKKNRLSLLKKWMPVFSKPSIAV